MESIFLKTIEAAAKAAATSAATSDPGEFDVILYSVLGVSMSSGLSQHWWSAFPSPTCPYNVFVNIT